MRRSESERARLAFEIDDLKSLPVYSTWPR